MENETLKVIKTRRSIRSFKDVQIKDEELHAIIDAGMYAPTAMGLQSPLILAIQNKEDVNTLDKLSLKVMGRGISAYYGAPTIVLILATSRVKEELGILDAAAVTTNMLNAAHSIGVDSIWINRCHEIFELKEGKELLKKWGIDEPVRGVASIGLGYRNCDYPTPKVRREGYYKIIK